MGFRFKKSVKVGGVRLNFGKRGTSVSIPGTGISYKSPKSKNRKKTSNKTVSVPKNPVINNTGSMFDRFNLTLKEAELLTFLIENENKLGNAFTLHDVSCLGHVSTNTYYNHLHDKGLLIKPTRGKYALNTQLIENVAQEWQNMLDERARIEAEEREKQWRNVAWLCRISWIPMVVLGCLLTLVDPMTGIVGIIIGVFEKIWSKKYFKEREKTPKCCSECGAANDTTYNFCIKCGTKLT